MNGNDKKVLDERVLDLHNYYKGKAREASAAYVKTGKAQDRMIATRYQAKVEVLKEVLNIDTK